MEVFGSALASSRRVLVAVGVAAMLSAAVEVHARGAAAQAPAEQQDPFKFSSPAAVIIWMVKPEGTADFESVWTAIRAKAAASQKPAVKAVADTLKVYKVDGPAGPQGVTYFLYADPTSATTSYSPTVLLYDPELFTREEADALFAKLKNSASEEGGINPLPLLKVE